MVQNTHHVHSFPSLLRCVVIRFKRVTCLLSPNKLVLRYKKSQQYTFKQKHVEKSIQALLPLVANYANYKRRSKRDSGVDQRANCCAISFLLFPNTAHCNKCNHRRSSEYKLSCLGESAKGTITLL